MSAATHLIDDEAHGPRAVPLPAWLKEAPFTLAMSSGFFGFFAHAGVLTALLEGGFAPAAVQGSSAGALVSCLWAGGVPPDRLAAELLTLTRADFWDPRPGLGILRGRLFDQRLRSMLPISRLEACPVPARLSVFDVLTRRTEMRTHGDLASAIRASCAVPVLFHPVWIDGRPKLDGGIADRPGLHGLAAGARVFHHHLLPTSPWRRKEGIHGRPPRRANMRSVAVARLPAVNPYRLDAGKVAFETALATMRKVLRQHS
jgi:NTE family protein